MAYHVVILPGFLGRYHLHLNIVIDEPFRKILRTAFRRFGKELDMTAKEYLNRVRSIEAELRNKESRLAKFRQDILTLQSIDYGKDRVDGGVSMDMADKIAKIETLEQQVNDEWDELIYKREEAAQLIEQLENPKYKGVLIERYINCKSWEKIAVELNYSWKGMFKVHGQALKEFERVHSSTLKYIEVHTHSVI